jgi:alkanesulfonate monooxygenase SsuD/methylene tetrahydromethanopterin reductase-like flavin-dependent oxidoreductase (luciferase family)
VTRRPQIGLALPLAGRGEPAAFVRELVEEVRAADEAGFDLCLIPEHHRGPRTSIVAPLTLAAALATVTERIRIGPGVLVLPVHAPRHVAEQVTMIDQLSGGRALLGVGVGYQREDFEPFGVALEGRDAAFERALAEVGRLLGEEGGLTPPPVQSPRPPIWVGAWSAAGLRRAATLADGWIADPMRTVGEVAAMAGRYREACGSAPGRVVVMREAWVGSGPEQRERFAAVIEPVFRYYRRNGAADVPEAFDELARDRFVLGSAEECVAQVEELAERTGADAVVLALRQPGGPDHETVVGAIRALGAARERVASA